VSGTENGSPARTFGRQALSSVAGLEQVGILVSKAGKVRLLKTAERPVDRDPSAEKRLTVWDMAHPLICALESGGDIAAEVSVAKLGAESEAELRYRLYTLCERKERAHEATPCNALVQCWPENARLARENGSTALGGTGDLFDAPLP
jgi:putative DNA methylase